MIIIICREGQLRFFPLNLIFLSLLMLFVAVAAGLADNYCIYIFNNKFIVTSCIPNLTLLMLFVAVAAGFAAYKQYD